MERGHVTSCRLGDRQDLSSRCPRTPGWCPFLFSLPPSPPLLHSSLSMGRGVPTKGVIRNSLGFPAGKRVTFFLGNLQSLLPSELMTEGQTDGKKANRPAPFAHPPLHTSPCTPSPAHPPCAPPPMHLPLHTLPCTPSLSTSPYAPPPAHPPRHTARVLAQEVPCRLLDLRSRGFHKVPRSPETTPLRCTDPGPRPG